MSWARRGAGEWHQVRDVQGTYTVGCCDVILEMDELFQSTEIAPPIRATCQNVSSDGVLASTPTGRCGGRSGIEDVPDPEAIGPVSAPAHASTTGAPHAIPAGTTCSRKGCDKPARTHHTRKRGAFYCAACAEALNELEGEVVCPPPPKSAFEIALELASPARVRAGLLVVGTLVSTEEGYAEIEVDDDLLGQRTIVVKSEELTYLEVVA